MFKGITNALKGIGGEYELTRVIGALGSVAYIVGTNAFVAWHMYLGREFDLTAYCVAFPGGFAAMMAAIAGAVSVKDRNVAVAKDTEAKTLSNSIGDGTKAVVEAAHEAAEQVAGAATDEKDKITKAVT